MRVSLFVAVSLAAAACSQTPRPEVIVPAQTGPVAFFTITEEDENGDQHVHAGGRRSHIDINSAVNLDPIAESFAGSYRGLTGAKDDAYLQRVLLLTDSLAQARDLLASLNNQLVPAATKIAAAAVMLERNPNDKSAEGQLRTALALHGTIVITIVGFLEARHIDTNPAFAKAEADYAAVGELMRGYVQGVADRLRVAINQFAASRGEGGARVQVWAINYGRDHAPRQVHLEGYDNLPAGDPRPVDKLSFSMTKADEERLERSHAVSREALALAASLKTNAKQLEGDAKRIIDVLKEEVAALGVVIDSLPAVPDFAVIRSQITDAALTPGLRLALDNFQQMLVPINTLRTARAAALESFAATTSPNAPFTVLAKLQTDVRAVITNTPNNLTLLKTQVKASVDAVAQAASAAVADVANTQRAKIEGLVVQRVNAWRAAADRIDKIVAPHMEALDHAQKLWQLADLSAAAGATELSPDEIQRRLISLRADEVRPTVLDVSRIEPRDGDRVVINVRVLDGTTGSTLVSSDHTFAIRTYGFHRRWLGGLGFGKEDGGDHVQPGIVTSWILHYRARPNAGGSASTFGTLLHPNGLGVGLTSVMFTRDDDIQLGFGPSLTLFGDLVQFGAGYNLQSEKWYGLLSTPLLDILERFRGDNRRNARD